MWILNSDRPIYLQLMEEIQRRIITGTYQVGERLPSVRELAEEASVNPNTMQKALSKLEEDGLILTHRTSGRSVTEDANMIKLARNHLAQEQIIEFLEKMKLLGFEKQETLTLITKMLEEMKK